MEQSLVNDPFSPVNKSCSFCDACYDDDNWGIMGWIGILPISLCVECQVGIFNMVYKLTPPEDLEDILELNKE